MSNGLLLPRIAVLIDGENVSHRLAPRVFELAAQHGDARVRRLYRDFRIPAPGWDEAANRYALVSRHCSETSKGKNGADIALAIDATDLLRDGNTDGFCIVSSDGDFAALALRIRRDGHTAFGMGGENAPAGYRDACTRFFCLDPQSAAVAVKKPASVEPAHKAMPAIRAALSVCPQRDGWYWLGEFGKHARKAGLDPEAHGATNLSRLLQKTGQFDFNGIHRFRPAPLRAIAGGQ